MEETKEVESIEQLHSSTNQLNGSYQPIQSDDPDQLEGLAERLYRIAKKADILLPEFINFLIDNLNSQATNDYIPSIIRELEQLAKKFDPKVKLEYVDHKTSFNDLSTIVKNYNICIAVLRIALTVDIFDDRLPVDIKQLDEQLYQRRLKYIDDPASDYPQMPIENRCSHKFMLALTIGSVLFLMMPLIALNKVLITNSSLGKQDCFPCNNSIDCFHRGIEASSSSLPLFEIQWVLNFMYGLATLIGAGVGYLSLPYWRYWNESLLPLWRLERLREFDRDFFKRFVATALSNAKSIISTLFLSAAAYLIYRAATQIHISTMQFMPFITCESSNSSDVISACNNTSNVFACNMSLATGTRSTQQAGEGILDFGLGTVLVIYALMTASVFVKYLMQQINKCRHYLNHHSEAMRDSHNGLFHDLDNVNSDHRSFTDMTAELRPLRQGETRLLSGNAKDLTTLIEQKRVVKTR